MKKCEVFDSKYEFKHGRINRNEGKVPTMASHSVSTIMPVQVDDFADRVVCLQNLYKDLISAHPCANIFGSQLDVVGRAISGLADQARLASLYGKATLSGRKEIMWEAKRVAGAGDA